MDSTRCSGRVVGRERNGVVVDAAVPFRTVVIASGVPGRLNPCANAAIGLLRLEEVPDTPVGFVEDVWDAVAGFGDVELGVGEVLRMEQIEKSEGAGDVEVHGAG